MWKAAFSGRSETAGKSKGYKAESVGSSVSRRRSDDGRRKSDQSTKRSVNDEDDADEGSYAPASTSRPGPGALTESAVKALDKDEREDEDKDARSERRSRRSDSRERRRKERRQEDGKHGKRRESEGRRSQRSEPDTTEGGRRSERDSDLQSEKSRGKARIADGMEAQESTRVIPPTGNVEQSSGQESGAFIGPLTQEQHNASGAMPSSTPHSQFQAQDPASFSKPQFRPNGLTRADSYGAAADYYSDEGQSVTTQPGVRPVTPNMLVNPDQHLMAATIEEHFAEDTGHGSAADFYSGRVSPVLTQEPSAAGRQSPGSSRPTKLGRIASTGAVVAASAASAASAGILGIASSLRHSKPQPSHRPSRQDDFDPTAKSLSESQYSSAPNQARVTATGSPPHGVDQDRTPQSSASRNAVGGGEGQGQPRSLPIPIDGQTQSSSSYNATRGGIDQGQPRSLPMEAANSSILMNRDRGMGEHYHKHKGPMTRLKDGLLNLIADPEDVIKMEMYTEYIGVCKHCFDPRTTPFDGPRKHHYHKRRDSFEDLRKRRSMERMQRKGSSDSLRRNGSQRVDKDARYYTSDTGKRRRGSTTNVLGVGLAAAGIAAGTNALFNDRKDFDDTYSIKSGHRESSALGDRSSSRESRRRSSHGVMGKDGERRAKHVTVRTRDGKIEKRRVVDNSRSRSRDRTGTLSGIAAGAGVGVGAASYIASRPRDRQDTQVKSSRASRRSRIPDENQSSLRNEVSGFSDGKTRRDRRSPNSSYYDTSRQDRPAESGGLFSGFFSPPQPQRRERRGSRERRKKRAGFFNFANGSTASSDDELAFGESFTSKTNPPLRRKSSRRKSSDERLAATVAGIGATAAALAAAQKGQRISKRTSRPELLGARREVRVQHDGPGVQDGSPAEEEGWEDELPSDVDDASSVDLDLAFGGSRLSHRQSMESVGSNDGLSAWGWRWGGRDRKKRRSPSPLPTYPLDPDDSFIGTAGASVEAADSMTASMTSVPQRPMQYVDPQPLSEGVSRRASMPGTFDTEIVRPGPAPLQQPQPMVPIQPSFVQGSSAMNERHPPRRTASSPAQSALAQDAVLIGGAALVTAGIIASQGKRSKEGSNVRFGLTEEQQRKEDLDKRRERERADEERRRTDRTRALKEEADRQAREGDARRREQDVLRAREIENRRAAETELERQRVASREAAEQAEMDRQRGESERREREEADSREQAHIAQRDAQRRAEQERLQRDTPHQELQLVSERKQRELERWERDQRSQPRQQSRDDRPQDSTGSWGPMAAGAAGATIGAVLAGREHQLERESDRDGERRGPKTEDNIFDPPIEDDVYRQQYAAKQVQPGDARSGPPIVEDDIFDPDFFKRKRSGSEQVKNAAIASRVAERVLAEQSRHQDDDEDKTIADMDAYYNAPKQSQAEFFAPREILDEPPARKISNADPADYNTQVEVYHEPDAEIQAHFHPILRYEPKSRSRTAPFGVPGMKFTTPTPPSGTPRDSRSPERSPLAQVGVVEPQSQANGGAERTARKKSISWGEDRTHVYDVISPESVQDKDLYVTAQDVPAGSSTGIISETSTPGSREEKVVAQDEYETRDRKRSSHRDDTPEVVTQTASDVPPQSNAFYRQPFYQSVSDIGLGGSAVASPGTERAQPVRGFVEGKTDESTPAEEKRPYIPGGFDTNGHENTTESASHEASFPLVDGRNVLSSRTAALEPELSKKDKKKREKAAKRADILDSIEGEFTRPVPEEIALPASEPTSEPQEEPDDYVLSKKDKKKRDKAVRRDPSDLSSPVSPETTRADLPEHRSALDAMSSSQEMPKLGKKEQRKLDKEAKKKGLYNEGEDGTAAGGIVVAASVAGAAASLNGEDRGGTKTAEPSEEYDLARKSSKKAKKSKKGASDADRNIKEVEPADIPLPSDQTESSDMPGSWQTEDLTREPEQISDIIDPFQFQIKDDPDRAGDDWSGFATGSKKSKKSKRDRDRLNDVADRSSSRAEVQPEQHTGSQATTSDNASRATPVLPHLNGSSENDTAVPHGQPRAERLEDREAIKTSVQNLPQADDRRQVLPGDGASAQLIWPDEENSVSVASEPTMDVQPRRTSQGRSSQSENGRDYDDDTAPDDNRSVANSEPIDMRNKKSNRRSRHEDDDNGLSSSSRSRREKDGSTSSKKDKKTGIFGLFGRKSTDTTPQRRQSTKSDDSVTSRRSTRENKEADDEDGETTRRRKKHREGSSHGDDDTKSIDSESGRKTQHDRDEHHDDEAQRRRASRGDDQKREDDSRDIESYNQDRRHDEDEDASELPRRNGDDPRHHRRRKTDEGQLESQRKSFLGKRVENLPPLPASEPASPVSAPFSFEEGFNALSSKSSIEEETLNSDQQRERDLPARQDVTRTALSNLNFGPDSFRGHECNAEQLPALPASRPESPTAADEMPQWPTPSQRPTSTTTVPLRFPFGSGPMSSPKERRTSVISPILSDAMSPASAQKKPRPSSTEYRPFYLLESTRKTPDVDESFPSLPSSKPSSRASSVLGSDDWHSAAEDAPSPGRDRGLSIDTDHANAYRTEEDYLDSQETTPKASEFPQTAIPRPAKQKPQFYTWADFEQDERLHGADLAESKEDLASTRPVPGFNDPTLPTGNVNREVYVRSDLLPALPNSRPGSPYELDEAQEVGIASAGPASTSRAFHGSITPFTQEAHTNSSDLADQEPLPRDVPSLRRVPGEQGRRREQGVHEDWADLQDVITQPESNSRMQITPHDPKIAIKPVAEDARTMQIHDRSNRSADFPAESNDLLAHPYTATDAATASNSKAKTENSSARQQVENLTSPSKSGQSAIREPSDEAQEQHQADPRSIAPVYEVATDDKPIAQALASAPANELVGLARKESKRAKKKSKVVSWAAYDKDPPAADLASTPPPQRALSDEVSTAYNTLGQEHKDRMGVADSHEPPAFLEREDAASLRAAGRDPGQQSIATVPIERADLANVAPWDGQQTTELATPIVPIDAQEPGIDRVHENARDETVDDTVDPAMESDRLRDAELEQISTATTSKQSKKDKKKKRIVQTQPDGDRLLQDDQNPVQPNKYEQQDSMFNDVAIQDGPTTIALPASTVDEAEALMPDHDAPTVFNGRESRPFANDPDHQDSQVTSARDISSETQPLIGEERNTPQSDDREDGIDEDEDGAWVAPTKKSKKGKKGKTDATSTPALPTSIELQGGSLRELIGKTEQSAGDPQVDNVSSEDHTGVASVVERAATESSWNEPPTKKKDKKAKKSRQASLAQPFEDSSATVSASEPEKIVLPAQSSDRDLGFSSLQKEDVEPEDPWDGFAKSAKQKKGKKSKKVHVYLEPEIADTKIAEPEVGRETTDLLPAKQAAHSEEASRHQVDTENWRRGADGRLIGETRADAAHAERISFDGLAKSETTSIVHNFEEVLPPLPASPPLKAVADDAFETAASPSDTHRDPLAQDYSGNSIDAKDEQYREGVIHQQSLSESISPRTLTTEPSREASAASVVAADQTQEDEKKARSTFHSETDTFMNDDEKTTQASRSADSTRWHEVAGIASVAAAGLGLATLAAPRNHPEEDFRTESDAKIPRKDESNLKMSDTATPVVAEDQEPPSVPEAFQSSGTSEHALSPFHAPAGTAVDTQLSELATPFEAQNATREGQDGQQEFTGFTRKQSKKDKKRDKKNISATPGVLEDLTPEQSVGDQSDPNRIKTAHPRAMERADDDAMRTSEDTMLTDRHTGELQSSGLTQQLEERETEREVSAEQAPDVEATEWTDFSVKQTKKDKRKTKKSGASTPIPSYDPEYPHIRPDPEDAERRGENSGSNERPNAPSSSSGKVQSMEHGQHGDDALLPALPEDRAEDWLESDDRREPSKELTSDTVSEPRPEAPHGVDFAATVAAGLADSGFDPNMVINDPVFHRRTSPPGVLAEADPEENYSFTTKRSKKGKKLKGGLASVSQESASGELVKKDNENPQQEVSDNFDATVAKGLAGAGFDASILQQGLTSGDASASGNVNEENNDLFTTGTKKKNKKSKARRAFQDETTDPVDSPGLRAASGTLHESQDHDGFDFGNRQQPDAKEVPRTADIPEAHTNIREEEQPAHPPATRESEPVIGRLPTLGDPASAFAIAGEREFDVDEMDQQCKAYKKKDKRNKKKEKFAAGAADRSEPTVDASEGLKPAAVALGASALILGIASQGHEDERQAHDHSERRDVGSDLEQHGFQAAAREISQPAWSFAALQEESRPVPESSGLGNKVHHAARDSGYQEGSSPASKRQSTESACRDAPVVHATLSRESLRARRSAEPLQISTDVAPAWDLELDKRRAANESEQEVESQSRQPSHGTPLESTTKNRASYLFQSPQENVEDTTATREDAHARGSYDGNPALGSETLREIIESTLPPERPTSPRGPLESIPEEHHAVKRSKAITDTGGPENAKAIRRSETPQAIRASHEEALSPSSHPPGPSAYQASSAASNPLSTDELIGRLSWPAVDEDNDKVDINRSLKRKSSKPAVSDMRSPSVLSDRAINSTGQVRSPEDFRSYSRASNRSSTPTLRRTDRSMSGDLRSASQRGSAAGSAVGARSSPRTVPFEPPPTPPSNDDDVIVGSAARAAAMSDVFGYGDANQSQVSPTRPPSMRKRQSLHVVDLEARLDQLVSENRALHEAKQNAEQSRGFDGSQYDANGQSIQETLSQREIQLREKDAEINQIRAMLQPMQAEIERLMEVNGGLTEANRNLVDDTNGRYATLQQEHAHAHEQWQSSSRELDGMRQEHGRLTSGMNDIVETEIASALADKNAEIIRLREELDVATEQIRALQVEIQSSKSSDFLTIRDEDYFDGACQKLCQHVQQWVLRFSKLSDNRICRLSTDLNDEKIEERLDNAILDGSDIDKLLGDRVRRRDIFMSVVMTMVWEYVFTRYLFGMDREQRQKLKALEKQLAAVGPPRAVAQWRAITLTLLCNRPDFARQCSLDTEAVASEIFGLLCALLPPPSNAEGPLQASLQKVISVAVDLSIEMRTQRAEYIMLPPLLPEYDTNGDLVRKVHFTASLMNERSGMFSSNETLEQERAVVKIVLFPLVLKKGDEVGEGEDEIVVCPAQVLVHNDGARGKKVVRVMSGAMEIDDPKRSRQSLVSTAPGSAAF